MICLGFQCVETIRFYTFVLVYTDRPAIVHGLGFYGSTMIGMQSPELPVFHVERETTMSPTDSVNGMQVDVVQAPCTDGCDTSSL